MFGIMAGMNQQTVMLRLLLRSSSFLAVACAWLVLLVTMHLTLFLTCLLCAMTGAPFLVVDILVVVQRLSLMVQTVLLITETPQLLLDVVVDVPVVASARAVRTWNLDIISRPWFWQSLVQCSSP